MTNELMDWIFDVPSKPGPPDQKRHTLCIYKDESQCRKGDNPEVEVELLKVPALKCQTKRVVLWYYYVLLLFKCVLVLAVLFSSVSTSCIRRILEVKAPYTSIVLGINPPCAAGVERAARPGAEGGLHHQLFGEEQGHKSLAIDQSFMVIPHKSHERRAAN